MKWGDGLARWLGVGSGRAWTAADMASGAAKVRQTAGPCQFVELTSAEMAALQTTLWAQTGRPADLAVTAPPSGSMGDAGGMPVWAKEDDV